MQKIVVIAWVPGDLAVPHVNNMVGQLTNEVDIMANETDGPFKGAQRLHEHVHAGHVEVRGGLIQKQKVRRVQEQPRQAQSAFFSPLKTSTFLNTASPRKRNDPKTVRTVSSDYFGRCSRLHPKPFPRPEHFCAVLRK